MRSAGKQGKRSSVIGRENPKLVREYLSSRYHDWHNYLAHQRDHDHAIKSIDGRLQFGPWSLIAPPELTYPPFPMVLALGFNQPEHLVVTLGITCSTTLIPVVEINYPATCRRVGAGIGANAAAVAPPALASPAARSSAPAPRVSHSLACAPVDSRSPACASRAAR